MTEKQQQKPVFRFRSIAEVWLPVVDGGPVVGRFHDMVTGQELDCWGEPLKSGRPEGYAPNQGEQKKGTQTEA